MQVTIYSWDLDRVRSGGWAISMREYAELLADHGARVRFVHSRVDGERSRGTDAGGPPLDDEQIREADVVGAYDSADSMIEIIEFVRGRRPVVATWSVGDLAVFRALLAHANVWVMCSSPTLAARVAREKVPGAERVVVLPRGRRWKTYHVPPKPWPRDRVGLGFGVKALIRGDGSKDRGDGRNHNAVPRFGNDYGRSEDRPTGLEVGFSSLDVARELGRPCGGKPGRKSLVATWAPELFAHEPFVEAVPPLSPHTRMGELYVRCRLYLLSHYWESFGATMLEAQRFGVPVVYLREPDVADPQLSFSGLAYTTLDEAVATARRLLADDAEWCYWSLVSRQNAARFNLDDLAPQYMGFFQRVCKEWKG
jgi:glycosyltransferase involved in cell wall biosynthesis